MLILNQLPILIIFKAWRKNQKIHDFLYKSRIQARLNFTLLDALRAITK